jgi:hypothetical protein
MPFTEEWTPAPLPLPIEALAAEDHPSYFLYNNIIYLGFMEPESMPAGQDLWYKAHIPPNLVVGRFRRALLAPRSQDLEVEHPIRGREATALYLHPTRARVQGPALVRDQVVQMRQAGEKRRLTPPGMVESLHGEEFAVDGVVRLIQHRAPRRPLRVCEHGIPAGFGG